MVDLAVTGVAALLVAGTLMAVWRHEAWWVRAWDFPRSQILVVGLATLWVGAAAGSWGSPIPRLFGVALVLCLAFQSWRIWPYTPLRRRQSQRAKSYDPGARLSIMLSNVLMDNREYGRLLKLVRRQRPDLFFAAETDGPWIEALRALGPLYPHTVEVPQDDTYGMVLFSRLELVDPRVEYLMAPDVPSIHGRVRLPNGAEVSVHFLHPKPPAPAESLETTERDAEILKVGRRVRSHPGPSIVAGDLNDVAWSHTTRLFQRLSGMLDPRIGRGLYSTFHAHLPFLRWPLDHVFHTDHFKLITLRRLPGVGSDHFPIFVDLCLEPLARGDQEVPSPNPGDLTEVREKIKAGEEA